MAELDKTRQFADIHNRVGDYFYDIAPKKKLQDIYYYKDDHGLEQTELVDHIELDQYSIIPTNTKSLDINRDEYIQSYNSFITELNQSIFTVREPILRAHLCSMFKNHTRSERGIVPTIKQLICSGYERLDEICQDYMEYRSFLSKIVYDGSDNWIYSVATGIKDYRDALLDHDTALNSNVKKGYLVPQYNATKVAEIYDFCIKTNVFGNEITLTNFTSSIDTANFKEIFSSSDVIKSKLKLVINALSYSLNSDWYKQTATSIKSTPSKCSGANVSENWKNQLNAIK